MRCLTAGPTCLALLAAFCMAPFQHVHSGHDDGGHEHPAVMHAHFHLHWHAGTASEAAASRGGVRLIASEDEDAAEYLNFFTAVSPAVTLLLFTPQSTAAVFAPSETFTKADFIEERGHDPPLDKPPVPRAPPS